ncbi:MAG: group II intron maturase-specific domain-containing protein, partial [Cyanobacteria bacterium P01_F01_bin.143]
KLNPIIKGWCNYYRTVCSSEMFSKLDHLVYLRLEKWANRRHSKKNKHWVRHKYWHSLGNDNWIFGISSEQNNFRLLKHTETKIIRHTKIQNTRSPYDGDANYWASRMGKHPEMKTSIAKLLKKQGGKCNWCNLHFQPGDKIECDHIVPQKAGGNSKRNNLQVLHRHCHDEKTKDDLETIRKYKAEKEWQKILKQFAAADWQWVDDIPTITGRGTHKEPVNERSAVR